MEEGECKGRKGVVMEQRSRESTGEDSAVEVVENIESLVPADDIPLDVSDSESPTVPVPSFCSTANSWLTRFWTDVTG